MIPSFFPHQELDDWAWLEHQIDMEYHMTIWALDEAMRTG